MVHQGCAKEFLDDHHQNFDSACVQVLNTFCKKNKLRVVVSSTWRILRSLEDLEAIFNKRGLNIEIIGKTPRDPNGRRGKEILMWLADNSDNENFVVIDDDIEDITPFVPREKIIYVHGGWLHAGIKHEHVIEWEKRNG